jgi:flagellar hook-associated protein 1 FlgK
MEMARNAMQTARQGAEIAGNNLANASNPIYARQRVKIVSAVAIPTDKGPQGSGAEVGRIEQVRDYAIDKQLVVEKSVTAFLEAKQRGLQMAETSLGQTLDRQSINAGDAYSTFGVSEGLTDLFNSFQSLSVTPTSTAERQTTLYNAQKLSDKFRSVDRRLEDLRESLNKEIKVDIVNANANLEQLAYLASSIGNTELVEGAANEVRDVMQFTLENLSQYVNLTTTTNEDGKMSVFIAGEEFITDNVLTDIMKVVTNADGYHSAASAGNGTALNLSSGKIAGAIAARDGATVNMRSSLNTLAAELITQVNTLHNTGYDLSGNNDNTLNFFTGTGAADISVNSTLKDDPRKLQMSAAADEVGDNTVARSLANLNQSDYNNLNAMGFTEHYGNTVSSFGQELSLVNVQLNDQRMVQNMLQKQRDSVQGVSIDEEVANLVIFQRAFQASARLITTMNTLMGDVINMQR